MEPIVALILQSFNLLIIFFTMWIITFFISLPLGVKRDNQPLPGHDPGAPVNHNLKIKFKYSILGAVILTIIYYILFIHLEISLLPINEIEQ